eukprot:NODE_1248_length_1409_cov_75.007800_g1237_i0.p1 GENE.NODE_1248_length_1409_cov_75.007800_g1237_i0~~NODE_1248_length_1409_cov_75.007800_g1237_i0.p1  ORF type:complete len:416 (-),score=32.11 NODE_1248_length_1409_cov_75.007800_g1237_i0:63-1310(-)
MLRFALIFVACVHASKIIVDSQLLPVTAIACAQLTESQTYNRTTSVGENYVCSDNVTGASVIPMYPDAVDCTMGANDEVTCGSGMFGCDGVSAECFGTIGLNMNAHDTVRWNLKVPAGRELEFGNDVRSVSMHAGLTIPSGSSCRLANRVSARPDSRNVRIAANLEDAGWVANTMITEIVQNTDTDVVFRMQVVLQPLLGADNLRFQGLVAEFPLDKAETCPNHVEYKWSVGENPTTDWVIRAMPDANLKSWTHKALMRIATRGTTIVVETDEDDEDGDNSNSTNPTVGGPGSYVPSASTVQTVDYATGCRLEEAQSCMASAMGGKCLPLDHRATHTQMSKSEQCECWKVEAWCYNRFSCSTVAFRDACRAAADRLTTTTWECDLDCNNGGNSGAGRVAVGWSAVIAVFVALLVM